MRLNRFTQQQTRRGQWQAENKTKKKSLQGVSQRNNTRKQIPQISRDFISNVINKKVFSFILFSTRLFICWFCGRAFWLTLVFPEDPRAHELEEATGVEAGPVDRDRVLWMDRWDVNCVKANRLSPKAVRAPESIHLHRRTPGPSTSVPASWWA